MAMVKLKVTNKQRLIDACDSIYLRMDRDVATHGREYWFWDEALTLLRCTDDTRAREVDRLLTQTKVTNKDVTNAVKLLNVFRLELKETKQVYCLEHPFNQDLVGAGYPSIGAPCEWNGDASEYPLSVGYACGKCPHYSEHIAFIKAQAKLRQDLEQKLETAEGDNKEKIQAQLDALQKSVEADVTVKRKLTIDEQIAKRGIIDTINWSRLPV